MYCHEHAVRCHTGFDRVSVNPNRDALFGLRFTFDFSFALYIFDCSSCKFHRRILSGVHIGIWAVFSANK